jgi:hypothetical protein
MSIKDITIGEFQQFSGLLSGSNEMPVEIGKAYLFRTVTHIEVGRVFSICGKFVTLERASWIADTGRYHDCLKSGVFSEVEPYPDTTTLNMDSMINFCPWPHDLPTDQK